MEQKDVVKLCKELGCCDGCCLRFLGLKNPNVYEDTPKSILKYQEEPSKKVETAEADNTADAGKTEQPNKENVSVTQDTSTSSTLEINTNGSMEANTNGSKVNSINDESPLRKRRKLSLCVCCLGILQPMTWDQCVAMVRDDLERKGYESTSFACALSAPIATILRERAVALHVKEQWTLYDDNTLTPLKEAWKWSFGMYLSKHINLTLDSGATCPLLITVNMEYSRDDQECEVLKTLSPGLFQTRASNSRRFAVEFTRRSAEQALQGTTLQQLRAVDGWSTIPCVDGGMQCVSVRGCHAPIYIAGRYVKLSRELPQTPWILSGRRMMESSVQEVIVSPLLDLYRIPASESESRVKFMSGGREDVDVRCLGAGRPFAIEMTDPRRSLSAQELRGACDVITRSGHVTVATLTHVTREQLSILRKGEESKAKTYQALCVKLQRVGAAAGPAQYVPSEVTPADIARINAYTNTKDPSTRVTVAQRTPLRVLHRRPLIDRTRDIMQLNAALVPGHKCVFCVTLRTSAGTYIKEWVHGEMGRTRPSLGDAIRAPGGAAAAQGPRGDAIRAPGGAAAAEGPRGDAIRAPGGAAAAEGPRGDAIRAPGGAAAAEGPRGDAIRAPGGAAAAEGPRGDAIRAPGGAAAAEGPRGDAIRAPGGAAAAEGPRGDAIRAPGGATAAEGSRGDAIDAAGGAAAAEGPQGDAIDAARGATAAEGPRGDAIEAGGEHTSAADVIQDALGTRCDILCLDVLAVHLPWPPATSS